MAKGKRPQGMRSKQQRQRRAVLGAVTVAAILVVGIFFIAYRPAADAAYYKHVTPAELQRVLAGGGPVLVYFHSPT